MKYIWPFLSAIAFISNLLASHFWGNIFKATGIKDVFMVWKFYEFASAICFVALVVTTFGVLSGRIKY